MIGDSAIVSLIPLKNRQLKRQFERDAMRVIMPLEEVNTEFIYQLFNDECKASYNGLYQRYHELWLSTIEELVKTKKFPSVGIDKLWFERQYAPYGNA
jgi:hypothetical protein